MGRQDERREETRGRLLAAAEACFRRDGYAATTLEGILAEAGLARGTLYYHFDSKEALASALARRSLAAANTKALKRARGGALDRVQVVLRASARWVEANPELALAFYVRIREEGHAAGAGEPRSHSLRALLSELLGEAQSEGLLRADLPASELGSMLASFYFRAVLVWLSEGRPGRLQARLGSFLTLFLEGALSPAARPTRPRRGGPARP
jgi:TetR/AcrR family fatty acid metabolism transcriptional regulator